MVFLENLHEAGDVAQRGAQVVPQGVAQMLEFDLQLCNPNLRFSQPFDKLRANG